MKKQNKYSILIWIIVPVLGWYLIDRIIYYIFYKYPVFIVRHFQEFTGAKTKEDVSLNIGTFGDMYGALNSFASAIASIGAIIAIFVQIWLYYADKKREKKITLEKSKNKLYFFGYTIFTFSHKLHEIRLEHNSLIKILQSDFFDNLGFIDYSESKIQFDLFNSLNFEDYFSIISELVPSQRKNYFELLSLVKEIQKINSSFLPSMQNYLDEIAPMIRSFRQECENFMEFLEMDKDSFMKSSHSSSINEIKSFVETIRNTIDIQHLSTPELYIEKRDKINSIFYSMNKVNFKAMSSFMESQRKIEHCLKICNSINEEIKNKLNIEF